MSEEISYNAAEHEPPHPIDYESILDTTGLTPEDLAQEVQFGSYSGTVASMLRDEKCPVGSMVAKSYAEEGLAGVERQFGMLGMMDKNFKVAISDTTRALDAGQLSRGEVLAKAQANPDFLA